MVWKNKDGISEVLASGIVFHSHIPKTAGTSLLKSVKDALKPGEFIHWNPKNPYNIEASVLELREVLKAHQSVKVVHGHFMYGIHQALDGRPFKYISILRDPVARVFSHYKHAIQNNLPLMPEKKAQRLIDMRIEDAIREPDISYFYNNIQARFISGITEPTFDGRSEEDVLEICVKHVRENYCYLGTQASIANAVSDLSELLGSLEMQERTDNVRGRVDARQLFTADRLENILSQNRIDEALLTKFCPEHKSPAQSSSASQEVLANIMSDTYKVAIKRLLERLRRQSE